MKRSDRKKRSFKQGAGIVVIGEGPTEQYYLLIEKPFLRVVTNRRPVINHAL